MFGFKAEAEEPVGEIYSISATRASGTREAGRDDFDVIWGDANRYGSGGGRVGFEGAVRNANVGGFTECGMFFLKDLPDGTA
jgi:hypothetical protein